MCQRIIKFQPQDHRLTSSPSQFPNPARLEQAHQGKYRTIQFHSGLLLRLERLLLLAVSDALLRPIDEEGLQIEIDWNCTQLFIDLLRLKYRRITLRLSNQFNSICLAQKLTEKNNYPKSQNGRIRVKWKIDWPTSVQTSTEYPIYLVFTFQRVI